MIGEVLRLSRGLNQYFKDKASEETFRRAMRWPVRAASTAQFRGVLFAFILEELIQTSM